MELSDDHHRIQREVQNKDIVTDTEYLDSKEYGHPVRLYVQFDTSIDKLPQSFEDWMEENELVILNAGINNLDADGELCIQLQTLDNVLE